MRTHKLRGLSRRRGYTVTTVRNPKVLPAPDLVRRKFVATDINQLWVVVPAKFKLARWIGNDRAR